MSFTLREVKNFLPLFVLVVALIIMSMMLTFNGPEKTDEACVAALDSAEEILHGPVVNQTLNMAELASLVPDAFVAGATGDVQASNQIVESMNEISTATENDTDELDSLVEEYNENAEKCRA